VERDPTPLVAATANDLEACLADADFAAATESLRGVVSLRTAATPQAVTLRLDVDEVSLAHGFDAAADVRVTVAEDHAGPPTEVEGATEHPELAGWVERLLEPPEPAWADAAERFWSALSKMRGAPEGLLVVNLDTGDELRFGADAGGYEIHGPTVGLVTVLTGRAPLIDAAYEGTVFIRGSFPELSVLTGAGFAIRYGRNAGDG
jgi:hypothetical protein